MLNNRSATTGLTCGDMPAITNGYVNYINSSAAKYECKTGYTLLNEAKVGSFSCRRIGP